MVKIGMMIGDRYEILEKIGTGGMSDVYKAKCHKLNRFVAVKVLKQEFSENANFVSKFRIEAQAAAGLAHPNIVNVYDVGEENGIYYIVMELVEGITLKKYILKKSRLSFKEAVSIAIQVSMGIEAAHNNHIIHRDIKPQNIIISRDGKVKVTDFGIAKAATSNTITSNVMGSVHYTSPEQARGGYSDEKSDIYSLGITMFEMLTGRVPFNGETTVAIAIKHIQEELTSPREFVPEIPGSVEGIVIKCCQKSPDRRYQSMQELIADLKQSLMNPDMVLAVPNDPDMEGGTRMISDSDMAQIKRRTAYQTSHDYGEREEHLRLRSDTEAMYDEEDGMEDDNGRSSIMEKITTFLAIFLGLIICVIVVIVAVKIFGAPGDRQDENPSSAVATEKPTSEPVEEKVYKDMPDVVGKTVEEARNMLTELGIGSVVEYEESETVKAGVVISTNTAAGTQVEVGSKVTIVASVGPKSVEVPPVTNLTYENAYKKLTELGFTVSKAEAYTENIPAGYVMAQVPVAGTSVNAGTNITVTVSLGKDKIWVPNLTGYTEQEAINAATEAGLQIGSIGQVYSSEYAEGLVCYQSYSTGSYVEAGSYLDIKVSKGPQIHTYKCNAIINAPTFAEAPDYVSGMKVDVKLVADDGQVLLDTQITGFPFAANAYGIKASGGTLTMSYTVKTEGTTVTNPETGEITTTPGTEEVRSFTRRIEFVME